MAKKQPVPAVAEPKSSGKTPGAKPMVGKSATGAKMGGGKMSGGKGGGGGKRGC